jgi:hypothetical protein
MNLIEIFFCSYFCLVQTGKYLNDISVDFSVGCFRRPPVQRDRGRMFVQRRRGRRVNRQVSRRTRRSRFPSFVDDDQAPGTLPSTPDDFDCELVLGVGLEVVEHDVEVGRVSVLMTRLVNLRRFGLSVPHDVVPIVGNQLVSRKLKKKIQSLLWQNHLETMNLRKCKLNNWICWIYKFFNCCFSSFPKYQTSMIWASLNFFVWWDRIEFQFNKTFLFFYLGRLESIQVRTTVEDESTMALRPTGGTRGVAGSGASSSSRVRIVS